MMATASIPPEVRSRLVKFLGMLGSDQLGERAAAAKKADDLVRASGVRWEDVLVSAPQATDRPKVSVGGYDWRADLAFCRLHVRTLPYKDANFILSVSRNRSALTERQSAWVSSIADRLRRDGFE